MALPKSVFFSGSFDVKKGQGDQPFIRAVGLQTVIGYSPWSIGRVTRLTLSEHLVRLPSGPIFFRDLNVGWGGRNTEILMQGRTLHFIFFWEKKSSE